MIFRFDVYGRRVQVSRRQDRWQVVYEGSEGKHRPARDIALDPAVPASGLAQALADLCHEWASPAHPAVRPLDDV